MNNREKPIVFLSYRSEDRTLAQVFKNQIEVDFLGFPEVFLDDDLPKGTPWRQSLRASLAAASLVCVLRSEKSETRWLSMELGAAWVTGARIIPICYGNLKKKDLADVLGEVQAVDCTSEEDLHKLYAAIAEVVGCRVPMVSPDLISGISNFLKDYTPQKPTEVFAKRNARAQFEPYQNMGDGTAKSLSPITGTLVWTIPRRAARPGAASAERPVHVFEPTKEREDYCIFCEDRYFETSPEIARVYANSDEVCKALSPEEVFQKSSKAEFRRIPNLFPILSYDYWIASHNYRPTDEARARYNIWLDDPTGMGKQHLHKLASRIEGKAAGATIDVAPIGRNLFFSSHDLIISRKHFTSDGRNMGSGEITCQEHYKYFNFTIDTARDIYLGNPFVEYVVVFQNWLWQAGATLDHLHKQIVGIDEYGLPVQRYLQRIQENPQIFKELWDDSRQKGNLVAENEHAIAVVEYGRRYPTVGIYAKRACHLEDYSSDVVRDMSNLVHACHAALGPDRSTNEEWYYTPPREPAIFPWHVLILLRTNIQAGFEHATRIYINSYRPWEFRSELVDNMVKRKGHIDSGVRF